VATGLIALLDDIAALAKVAAATLDDAASQSAKAAGKAAGIVIDDAAVTPRYVVGFTADRELPIIWKIAVGSLKNKLLFILPSALALSAFAPWLIAPLLLIGGAYLCLEGYHKVMDLVRPHGHGAEEDAASTAATPEEMEAEKVASAIRTDFILSAEIMFITLGALTNAEPPAALWLQAIILGMVGVFMTALVYGAVALIVKADDWGAALALKGRTSAGKAFGRAVVNGMPGFLKALSYIGMVAMLWVGGGIFLHELYVMGMKGPETVVKDIAHAAAAMAGPLKGFVDWFVHTAIAAAIGLVLGALVNPLAEHVFGPLIARFQKKPAVAKAH
jgi:uncharacterized protein